MDEFRGSWCPYEVLLRILDGHPYQPEQKGGHVWAAYTKVIMTSNVNPNEWYNSEKIYDQSPLFRRITDIYYVAEPLYGDIVIEDVRRKPARNFPIFDPPSAPSIPTEPTDCDVAKAWQSADDDLSDNLSDEMKNVKVSPDEQLDAMIEEEKKQVETEIDDYESDYMDDNGKNFNRILKIQVRLNQRLCGWMTRSLCFQSTINLLGWGVLWMIHHFGKRILICLGTASPFPLTVL